MRTARQGSTKRRIHFVSGLPRSGSSLLCNLLCQNPRFHATSTSGILDVMLGVRGQWNQLPEFKASPNEPGKQRVLRGILESYFDDPEDSRPVVFDKSRGWLAHLEMAEAVLGRSAKVIVPVRDLRDVLASFEKLWRQNTASRQIPQEREHYFKWQTVEGRCEVWTSNDQPVGIAYNRIQDALARGFGDRLHFVRFEELTHSPKETMRALYAFLDEPVFAHDFERVEQVVVEDDEAHGIPNLHTIRKKVEPIPAQWPRYLTPALADQCAPRNALWARPPPQRVSPEALTSQVQKRSRAARL